MLSCTTKATRTVTLIEDMNGILAVDTVSIQIKIVCHFDQKRMIVRWFSVDWSDSERRFCFFSSLQIN